MEYRGWMRDPSKQSEEYIRGVNEFLVFAFQNSEVNGKILCPCTKCANYKSHSHQGVYEHLTDPRRGFLRGYRQWIFHGEKPTTSSSTTEQHIEMEHDMDGLIRDVFAMDPVEEPICREGEGNPEVGKNVKFYQLVKENEQMLYPNCKKYSKLSFMVHLYHLKCLHGWSDKSFSMLLDLLRDALPEGNVLPKSYYETKKMISGLGLGYEKIHACPNNCILYWDKYVKDQVCPKCGMSRWKTTNENVQANGMETSEKRKNIPAKILRWFPLKPRLQRLFMSSKIAESMRWHHDSRLNDGSLRHPADSLAWKEFDSRYPTFSLDPRNVRLGVASDGFNPFKTMSITHSTWPVMLIPYNLPPWMCMKQSFFMLSLLIPGPKGPGNNIDIYLQPLVQELQVLWDDGIETFDGYKKETFQLRAAIMWTINDFPAYANLSGWSTKGQYACPCCGIQTASRWLRHGRKFCYMCHRRWLAPNHKWRLNCRDFDGTQELRDPPRRLDGIEILRQIDEISEEDLANGAQPWKKKSIFFTLPYWQYNVLRHNLDVMHIEKNVCDNIIGTLLNQEGKSKDNYKARADLVDMGIRSMLHPQPSPKSRTMLLPRACYQMTTKEKDAFLSILKNVKAPDECSSNISRCVQVKQRKIFGLKSYDCHVLMQELLPVAMGRRKKLNIGHTKKLNIGHRMPEDSNQHTQASENQGIQSIPTHAASSHVDGSNVEETRSTPSRIEGVMHESVESHPIASGIEAEEVQIEKEPKRVRGPTRMLDLWDMDDDDFIIVNLDKYGRPIGEEGTTLTRFIGSVARRHQYAPINYKSWKEMPKKSKDEMLGIIEAKFDFVPPINDTTREMLKYQLNEKWRQWKGDLKSMAYDPSKTEEEVASALPDDRVEPNQYRDLVRYWFSENGQRVSEINRQNRAKFEDVHCMGTKSLSKLIDEKKKKSKGVSPERKEIYIDTRTRKDGSFVNEKAAKLIEELSKHNNEVGTSQSAQNTQSHMPWKDDIYSQVQGPEKRGRVRCMGKIHKSKKLKGSLSENQELRNEVKHMKNLLASVLTLVQNRFSGEDVNDIMQAAIQAPNVSSTPDPDHLSSPSPDTNEHTEYDED